MNQDEPKAGRAERDRQIRDAFAAEDALYAERYFDYLLIRQNEVATGIKRGALFILALGGLHYLLLKTTITEASVGGFQLNDLSLLRTVLPAVIAFLYYEMAGNAALQVELEEVSASLMRLSHPGVWKEGLFSHILPPLPAVFGSELNPLRAPAIVAVARWFQAITMVVMLLAPIVYVLRAIVIELTEFGPPGWEELGAVGAAVMFLIYAIILFVAGFRISARGGGMSIS